MGVNKVYHGDPCEVYAGIVYPKLMLYINYTSINYISQILVHLAGIGIQCRPSETQALPIEWLYRLLEPERETLFLPWGDLRHSLGKGDFQLCLTDELGLYRTWSRKGFLGRGNHDFLENSGWCFEQEGRRKRPWWLVVWKVQGETKSVRAFFLSLDSVRRLSPVWPLEVFEFVARALGGWVRRGKARITGVQCPGVLVTPFSACSCWASSLCWGCQFLPNGLCHFSPVLTFDFISPHSCPRGAAGGPHGGPKSRVYSASSPVNHGSRQMIGKLEYWQKIAVPVTKAWRVVLIPRLNRSRCNLLFPIIPQVIRH